MLDKTKKISPARQSVARFFNPFKIVIHLWQYRDLIRQLTRREVAGRYKGSVVGLGWSFIQPLTMLCIYTFVFSVIFKAKWGIGPDEGKAAFALALFTGMTTFSIFSELANAAPSLILANVNLVKKVVFPLEVLPVVKFLGGLTNAAFSLAILLAGILVVNGYIHWTVCLLPLVWLPLTMFSLGCGYFLASLGVFVRDIGATIGILTTMLFFLSPIFYPISAVPEELRIFCRANPIAIFVEDTRRVVLWGMMPDWPWFFCGLGFSFLMWMFGFLWFMKSKRAFADVM